SSGDRTRPTAVRTLSLHDALPILRVSRGRTKNETWPAVSHLRGGTPLGRRRKGPPLVRRDLRQREARDADRHRHERGMGQSSHSDRKSTRLNSSHVKISYAVFCLK